MHIISKFHDYYDTALGLGVDKTLIYKRVDEPGDFIDLPRWHYDVKEEKHSVGYNPSDVVTIRSWVIPLIFCGQLHLRALADVTYRNPKFCPGSFAPTTVTDRFTGPSRKAVLARIRAEHRLNEKTEEKPRYSRWYNPQEGVSFKEVVSTRDWIPTHIREGCPVFLIRNLTHEEQRERKSRWGQTDVTYRIQRNPSLKELGFYQVKQPFEAFQELSMFLGGVMGTGDRPMVQLTDKEVHAKHGFDKWSFRKLPER